ncbi:response regulator [Phenylobacterium kunshanense]|uniref:Response regulator n=1 Tax=Phenylobacterium kunshanense TaxID=1445034 RepID=A0A328BAT5_9CAUL|nr:response regulator [Phenylobacterium kunshanense]RAK62794.1 response regulator [Phenylobacterium kunshanense]
MLAPVSRPVVVVVDDDAAVRSSLAFSLDLQGFDVSTCESGEALLSRALPAGGACLVLDERLPGISGMEALRQLRQRDVTLPAILITSHPKPDLRAAAAAAGVPIVEKPLIGDALMTSIRRALTG